MARLPRLALAGWPHHLVQRVHPGQVLVHDDEDRQAWLRALREGAAAGGVALHAWVLLDDRFQLVATPERPESLSLMMQALGRRYVAVFNRRHGRAGGLWAGRFRATVLEPERHLLQAMVHVERQPVAARLVAQPQDHAWSSCGHHLGHRRDAMVIDPPAYWALGNTPFERQHVWRGMVEEGLSAEETTLLERATHLGWAVGSAGFLARVAAVAERPLQPRPRGRPRQSVPN